MSARVCGLSCTALSGFVLAAVAAIHWTGTGCRFFIRLPIALTSAIVCFSDAQRDWSATFDFFFFRTAKRGLSFTGRFTHATVGAAATPATSRRAPAGVAACGRRHMGRSFLPVAARTRSAAHPPNVCPVCAAAGRTGRGVRDVPATRNASCTFARRPRRCGSSAGRYRRAGDARLGCLCGCRGPQRRPRAATREPYGSGRAPAAASLSGG